MSIVELNKIPGITFEANSQGGFDYELDGVKAGYGRRNEVGPGTDEWLFFVGDRGPYSHPSAHGCEIGIKSLLVKLGLWDSSPEGNVHLDAEDAELLAKRQYKRDDRSAFIEKPITGDVLILADGTRTRVIGQRDEYVTHCADASFMLQWDGSAVYSGGNDGHVFVSDVERGDKVEAVFWFPHRDKLCGGCRVDARVMVTEWKVR